MIVRDLRDAWRAIRRMPVVAGVIVISLGVGIGVNTAVFSWIDAVVLRPIPGVDNPARFLLLEPRAETGSYPGTSWPEYRDLRERLSSFPDLISFRMVPLNIGEPGLVHRAYGLLISGNYFEALGLRPAFGRLIRPGDVTRPGAEPIAVVSYEYWRTRLGASPAVVGQRIRINDQTLTIIGVGPPRFQGTVLSLNFDMWVPATMAPRLLAGSPELVDRSLRGYSVMGEPAPGVTRARAQGDVDRAMRDLARTYPATNGGIGAEVLPYWQAPRGPQRMLAGALAVLQGVLLLLLLAVCGNTANLMLARATTRRREIGVRLAIGARPSTIVRLLLTESVVLSAAGAALGVLLAMWATDALRAVPVIGAVPIRFQTEINALAVLFAAALAIGCAALFGTAPALQLARTDLQQALHTGAAAEGRSRIRGGLMAVEMGLATVVLVAAAMFLRSFEGTREADTGFRREGVLLASYDLTGRGLDADATRTFAVRLLERLRALPGVEAAAIATSVPLDIHGLPMRSFFLEGRARDDGRPDTALNNTVTPGYFQTMGVPLLAGTDFAALDDPAAPPQVVVNDAFVRRFAGGREPIGRRVTLRGVPYTIAGVARTSLSESFDEGAMPVVYMSYRDRPAARGEIHVRTRVGAEVLLAPTLERIVRDIDPTLPLYDIRTLNEHVEKNLFLRRIPARMFVVLGPLLLVLAAIGIYAVVAYSISLRTREIGVRLTLGATPSGIVSAIVVETLRVVSAGAAAGWLLAFMVYLHLIRGPLYLIVFGGVPAALLAVAGTAAFGAARRAACVDPAVALRVD